MNKNTNEYYKLKIQGCLPFNVTPNHPLYVRRMNRHNKLGNRVFGKPRWVEVKDLSIIKNKSNMILEQDYIGFPIIQESKLPIWNGIEYEHNIYGKKTIVKEKHNLDMSSYNLWYFIGRYIGDGWLRDDRKEVIICCGKTERQEMITILHCAKLKFHENEEKTTFRYVISNVELYEYVKQFGKGAKNKHLTKDIFELPKYLLKHFIDGYLSADGYLDKKNNTYRITSISRELIYGLQQCIAKCYHQPTTITIKFNKNKIENRDVCCNIAYTLSFKKEHCKNQHFIYEDGYLWLPFRDKQLVEEPIEVFNFSVEDDESYTIYNFACHNCSTFSMAGLREEAWGVEKKFREGQKAQTLDDLLFVFIDTVAKLKPKVAIMENVEGLMLGNAWGYVQQIYKKFHEIGYNVKHWLLKGETMGVPQARHRVFFVATRLPFNLDCINMYFNYEKVTYGEIKEGVGPYNKDAQWYELLGKAQKGDKSLSDIRVRNELSGGQFNCMLCWEKDVLPTLAAKLEYYDPIERTKLSKETIRNAQTFPQDYDFGSELAGNVCYICGMSVPPIMIKRLVTRLIESGLFDYKIKE